MEVERSTDEAAGLGRDATGVTTTGSTDTTATSAGVVGMEVERPTDGAVGLGRDATGVTTTGSTDTAAAGAGADVATAGEAGGVSAKRRRGAGKKEKMTRNQLKRLKKQRERDG